MNHRFHATFLSAAALLAFSVPCSNAHAAVSAAVNEGVLSVSSDSVSGAGDSIVLGCSGSNVQINGEDPGGMAVDGASLTSIVITGGAGNDTIDLSQFKGDCVSNIPLSASGGDGDDVFIGSNRADNFSGGPGNDSAQGRNGADTLLGDEGDDILSGGNGKDTLDGGPGNDQLLGNNGKDNLSGGLGDDVLKGGNGNDILDAGQESDESIVDADHVDGGNGQDLCNGGETAKGCERGDNRKTKKNGNKGKPRR